MNNHDKLKYYKKCPLCNSKEFKKIYLMKWKESSFIKCNRCKLIFKNPQEHIENTLDRYDSKYFDYELKNEENFFNLIKKTISDFNILKILPEKSNILEIGSATGLFLQYMQGHGFTATGIEICTESALYGRKKHNVNIINKQLEEVNFKNDSFEFIHFSHLIEHLNNPFSFIKEINRILKKDGHIMLTTPNTSGIFAKIYKNNWRCIVDDHLFLFNKSNLIKLLALNNLRIVKYKTWGSIPYGTNFQHIKKFTDWFSKKYNVGDVISIVAQKV